MERLNEVLIAFNKGQMKIEDIAWLIAEVERLQVVEAAYIGMRLAK